MAGRAGAVPNRGSPGKQRRSNSALPARPTCPKNLRVSAGRASGIGSEDRPIEAGPLDRRPSVSRDVSASPHAACDRRRPAACGWPSIDLAARRRPVLPAFSGSCRLVLAISFAPVRPTRGATRNVPGHPSRLTVSTATGDPPACQRAAVYHRPPRASSVPTGGRESPAQDALEA